MELPPKQTCHTIIGVVERSSTGEVRSKRKVQAVQNVEGDSAKGAKFEQERIFSACLSLLARSVSKRHALCAKRQAKIWRENKIS
jgi:hypothetical protein